MKVEYDKEADAAYIYIDEIKAGEAKKTKQVDDNIIADFDDKGRLLGIEVLNASKILKKKLLEI